MLDPRCVLGGCWKDLDRLEEKREDKRKTVENLKKWMHWNRIKWNDGS